jgi:hypothetical protein
MILFPSLLENATYRQQQLLREAEVRRAEKLASAGKPGAAEQLAMRAADLLIAVGQRLKERYTPEPCDWQVAPAAVER